MHRIHWKKIILVIGVAALPFFQGAAGTSPDPEKGQSLNLVIFN